MLSFVKWFGVTEIEFTNPVLGKSIQKKEVFPVEGNYIWDCSDIGSSDRVKLLLFITNFVLDCRPCFCCLTRATCSVDLRLYHSLCDSLTHSPTDVYNRQSQASRIDGACGSRTLFPSTGAHHRWPFTHTSVKE